MIISHRSKYIYVHIPKTGGTSVEWQMNLNNAIVFGDDREKNKKHPEPVMAAMKHANLEYIKLLWGSPTGFYDQYRYYYRWTIVRNPFDRMISAYWYHKGDCEQRKQEFPFEDIADFIIDQNKWCQGVNCTKRPQTFFTNVDDKLDCEFYKYEDGLDSIVQRVSDKIRAKDPSYPRLTTVEYKHNSHLRQDRRHYREVLTPELRKFIEEFYESDLNTFNYQW